jgi:replicative DNA helicase
VVVENDLELQVFALSMQKEGAIDYFAEHLPVAVLRESGRGQGEFYQILLDFYSKTGTDPIDRVALKSWLEHETDLHEVLGGEPGVDIFFSQIDSVKEPSTPEAVAALLRYRHNKARQLVSVGELSELVQNVDHSDEHVAKINELADHIRQLNQTGVDPLRSVYDGERIAADAESLWELPSFLPTQFKSLNRAMGYSNDAGFMKGAVHAILAASGKGKSTFAKNLMNNWVEEGHSVLYVNYEEARAHWERILFTQITQQNVYLGNEVSEIDKRHYTQLFKSKMMEWDGRFMVKHDPDTPYYEDLEVWIRDVANRKGAPDVIIIDTIQSMFLKGTGKSLPRWGQYEEMMVRLEKLAKDLDAAIIITAQENSNRMKERREVVQQSDIGGSLAIAQKSSVTIFITDAKTESGDDSIDETVMQLQIPKNRITGVAFMMDPPLVKYNDECKSYVELELPPLERYDSTLDVDDIGEPY